MGSVWSLVVEVAPARRVVVVGESSHGMQSNRRCESLILSAAPRQQTSSPRRTCSPLQTAVTPRMRQLLRPFLSEPQQSGVDGALPVLQQWLRGVAEYDGRTQAGGGLSPPVQLHSTRLLSDPLGAFPPLESGHEQR